MLFRSIPFVSTFVFAAVMKHQDAPGTTFKRHMNRIVFQGVSKQKAIQEMTEGGFGFHRIYTEIFYAFLTSNGAQFPTKCLTLYF